MKRILIFLVVISLTGCLSDTRDSLQKCTAAAAITYPPEKPMPLGEPYKEILACMQRAGYTLDYEGVCKYRGDYMTNTGDAACYRPMGFFKGYFYDVTTTLR